MGRNLEAQESKALWQWIQTQPVLRDYVFHVPNGEFRKPATAALLKAMGVRPGISDYFGSFPRGEFHGLYVELKAGKNRETSLQADWGEKVQQAGYAYYCCRGWLQAAAVMRWYVALPEPKYQPAPQPPLEAVLMMVDQDSLGKRSAGW